MKLLKVFESQDEPCKRSWEVARNMTLPTIALKAHVHRGILWESSACMRPQQRILDTWVLTRHGAGHCNGLARFVC